jgi:hypothetical protein
MLYPLTDHLIFIPVLTKKNLLWLTEDFYTNICAVYSGILKYAQTSLYVIFLRSAMFG